MSLPKKEVKWGPRRRFLKAKLKQADITYGELAKRMKKHGFEETESFNYQQARSGHIRRDMVPWGAGGAGIGRRKVGRPLVVA